VKQYIKISKTVLLSNVAKFAKRVPFFFLLRKVVLFYKQVLELLTVAALKEVDVNLVNDFRLL